LCATALAGIALTHDLGALNKAVADAGIPPVFVVPSKGRK
jgi:hypothetical protein